MSSTISAPAAAAALDANDATEQPVKRGPGRPAGKTTKDLGPSGRAKAAAGGKRLTTKSGKTASQVIREYDEKHEDAKANDVVAYCHKLGLTNVVPANVYNCRQNVRKAEEAAAAAKASKKATKAKKTSKK
jgi:hypothetical protein